MTIWVILKLQGHDEVLWEGGVSISSRCWNGIRPGWSDVDEYDHCWNLLLDAIVSVMPDGMQYEDWYVYDYKED